MLVAHSFEARAHIEGTRRNRSFKMSIKEIYGKHNKTIEKITRDAHQDFIDALDKACEEKGITVSELTLGASAGPAATYRIKDPNANTTLQQMQRFAASAGKKVQLTLVDLEEEE